MFKISHPRDKSLTPYFEFNTICIVVFSEYCNNVIKISHLRKEKSLIPDFEVSTMYFILIYHNIVTMSAIFRFFDNNKHRYYCF